MGDDRYGLIMLYSFAAQGVKDTFNYFEIKLSVAVETLVVAIAKGLATVSGASLA